MHLKHHPTALAAALLLSACVGESHSIAPDDPCATTQCGVGDVCVPVVLDDCRAGQPCAPYTRCVDDAINPCEDRVCDPGSVCAIVTASPEDDFFIIEPPETDCVRLNPGPCADVACPGGESCFATGASTWECRANGGPLGDPCDYTVCASGLRCVGRYPLCRAGIPECYPYAECVPGTADSCDELECAPGQQCVREGPPCEGCPTYAHCVPTADPCTDVECGPGTRCEVVEPPCFAPGSCPDVAVCVPDLCGDVVCDEGYMCEEPSCDAALPSCEPRCVPVADACDDVQCRPDQHCELVDPPCAAPTPGAPVYCPAVPVCVDNPSDTCDGVVCGDGQHCELVQPPCTEPSFPEFCPAVPTSVADEPTDACDGVLCEQGQHCEVVWPPCAPPEPDAPMCEPVGVCVDDGGCEPSDCGGVNFLPLPTCDDGSIGQTVCDHDPNGVCGWRYVCPGDPCDDCGDIPACSIPGEPAGWCVYDRQGTCQFISNDACV